MTAPRLLPILLAAALLALPAHARECGEGRVSGGTSAQGDALQNFDCAMIGRLYCRLAEDRDVGLGQEEAAKRSAAWLNDVGRTGSHARRNWAPMLSVAATDVFAHPDRRPGPTYYRAAYSCGLVKRLGDEPAVQQRAGPAFAAAADRCEQQHVLKGPRSYPNRRLRDCLAAAVDELAPPGRAP